MPLSSFARSSRDLTIFMIVFMVLVAITIIADRCVGVFMPHSIVFPRHSVANYTTTEFKSQARINNFGFRGPDIKAQKERRYRIMTLGDSFTFGWGVDAEAAWPRVLEQALQKQGFDVEVINLGSPGGFSEVYRETSTRAIPLLKPDLIVVAINNGDDLGQTMKAKAATRGKGSWQGILRAVRGAAKFMYPNGIALAKSVSEPTKGEIEISAMWKSQVANLLPKLSAEEMAKFDKLDDEVKGMFVGGQLNPGILAMALRNQDPTSGALELEHPEVQDGIREMSIDLQKIKALAESKGGKVVVVSQPSPIFASRFMLNMYSRMGFTVSEHYLTTNAMDEAIRLSASMAGTAFLGVTQQFREESAERSLFFQFDGHFNGEGQRFFANVIHDFVSAELVSQ